MKFDDKREANRRHWDRTLDPRNLGAEGIKAGDWQREMALAESADVRLAKRLLHPLDNKLLLDLGGGLGIHALLFAEAGARIIIADISLERLKAARRLIERAGLLDRVDFVVCGAEDLPFVDHTFDRQFTKSVLIHTRLKGASEELARTLSPQGVATFIEPLTKNPFVNAYRFLAAPRAWKNITEYFDKNSLRIVTRAYRSRGFRTRIHWLYFLGFFATAFQFLIPSPWFLRQTERGLLSLDRLIFRLYPRLRQRCWFSVTEIRPGSIGSVIVSRMGGKHKR